MTRKRCFLLLSFTLLLSNSVLGQAGLSLGKIDSTKLPTAAVLNAGVQYQPDFSATEKILYTPGFVWHHGSTNAAAGTLLKYWDIHGWTRMMPSSQSLAIEAVDYQAIASDGHYQQYCLPLDADSSVSIRDESEPLGLALTKRRYDCVADFMNSSFSVWGFKYGETDISSMTSGLMQYAWMQYPDVLLNYNGVWHSDILVEEFMLDYAWNTFVDLINNDIPSIIVVNTDSIDGLDHAVCAIGYRIKNGKRYFIAYNGWDAKPRVYEFVSAFNPAVNSTLTTNIKPFGVGYLHSMLLSINGVRMSAVYQFYRQSNRSFFFTANEEEKKSVVSSIPAFKLSAIDHYVFSGKASEDAVPVFRFLNKFGAHFYTASEVERDAVTKNLSHVYTLEGVAYYVLPGSVSGAKPVYRFFQPSTSSHFFTISEKVKNEKIDNDKTMNFEGIAYYAFEPMFDH